MIRTKVIHPNTREQYEAAIIEAYEWALEEGGILIFNTVLARKDAGKVIAAHRGRQQIEKDAKSGKLSIGVARGQDYTLRGPRIAIFDGSDTDMKRIEAHFHDEWGEEGYSEIRSYTMTVDTHKDWTRTYNPEIIDRSQNS
ncbi:MAG: hypothetical protein J6D54_03725 [Olsenella sp.]|nr:hypothetical protein [Olsenella sp.]